MRATVDSETCTGCALCTETCPEVFEMIDDTATAKPGDVPAELEDACREADEECPVEAITLE